MNSNAIYKKIVSRIFALHFLIANSNSNTTDISDNLHLITGIKNLQNVR